VVLWLVAGLALVVGVAAFWSTRRLARKLDGLTQAYWELRYDYTRLRSQVNRLDPEQAEPAPDPSPAPSSVSFVPLSSLKGRSSGSG
jgi:hypothetical protein